MIARTLGFQRRLLIACGAAPERKRFAGQQTIHFRRDLKTIVGVVRLVFDFLGDEGQHRFPGLAPATRESPTEMFSGSNFYMLRFGRHF